MEVFTCPARFIVLAAGRRFGKTKLAHARAITSSLSEENERRLPVYIVAPTQAQAKVLYWQPLIDALYPLIKTVNVNEGLIYLHNKVMIGVKGSDRPDTLRGVGLFDLILDENADMKPDVWESILRPALSDVRGRALFIGTPKGRNHFYDNYQRGKRGEDPEWASFHFTSYDNPYLPEGEIEAARRTLSSAAFRQEYMASFEQGGGSVFKPEWIKFQDEAPKDKNGKECEGTWHVTADLAGFADIVQAKGYQQKRLDKSAIAVVKVLDDGRWWVRDIILGRWNTEETARRIVDAVDSCQATRVGIEKGTTFNAVGPYLRAEAAKRKIPLHVEALQHGNQAKYDRITWALQGRLEHGQIIFRRAAWNSEIEDQLLNFPSKMVHDDGIEALAYVAQLAQNQLFEGFASMSDEPYWEPTDADVGI